MNWWNHLDKMRGSRPRCVRFVDGSAKVVAKRLEALVNSKYLVGLNIEVNEGDVWAPNGLPVRRDDGKWDIDPANEAVIGSDDDEHPAWQNIALGHEKCRELRNWWLASPSRRSNMPNWDLASTCRVNGRKGIILVEAKAHKGELESGGKILKDNASDGSKANHKKINQCIAKASDDLSEQTWLHWSLSISRCYQMSNRFTWAHQLATMGFPVILVYLGFLDAQDMNDGGRELLSSHVDWQRLVKYHGRSNVPPEAWEKVHFINGQEFIPLIRSCELDFTAGIKQLDIHGST